jgi:virginiamycin A acetyltransferase
MRETVKGAARAIATLLILPLLASFRVRSWLLGPNRALEGSSQFLAMLPGLVGRYMRMAFLGRVLAECHHSAIVEHGTLLSQVDARLAENVYVGPGCHLGLACIERDVLLAAGVHVPSGARRHGIADASVSIKWQPETVTTVTIGQGTWVGSGAVVLADVGRHCVIGAGAVVTKPIPDYAVAVGVPAQVVRDRRAATPVEPAGSASSGR